MHVLLNMSSGYIEIGEADGTDDSTIVTWWSFRPGQAHQTSQFYLSVRISDMTHVFGPNDPGHDVAMAAVVLCRFGIADYDGLRELLQPIALQKGGHRDD